MRALGVLGAVVLLCMQVAKAANAHGAHNCGSRPFTFNASQQPPAALADPTFKHPWVQANVVVTYDPQATKDGLGSQVHRLFGSYAVAACSGLPFIHTAGFKRFTHINNSVVYDAANRMNLMLGLPTKPLSVNGTYRVVEFGRSCNITWDTLLKDTKAALAAKQPTMFKMSFTYGFALAHPAMLDCVPAFRQQPMSCGTPLLRPVRIAVHIRAGDAGGDPHRLLPHSYYYNITHAIAKAVRQLGRDHIVEVYTQAAFGIRHRSDGSYYPISSREYIHLLRHHFGRHMVLMADMDVLWTLTQMATADIFIHSKSTLSVAAGIMNVQGVNIAPPANSLPWPWLQGPHWLQPANASGAFDSSTWAKLAAQLEGRFGPKCRGQLPAEGPALRASYALQKPAR